MLSLQLLDHDDFGLIQSKIMNVIDSDIMRSGMRAENRTTLFLIPLLGARFKLAYRCSHLPLEHDF